MNEPTLTLVGNLTADPEIRFVASGQSVANFTVASTPRTFDKASGQWKDGEALFQRCQAWGQLAEHISESLTRGARVVVTGRLRARSFTTQQGENRTTVELTADEVGPSLRYATARVQKAERQAARTAPASADPWGAAPGELSDPDEAPF